MVELMTVRLAELVSAKLSDGRQNTSRACAYAKLCKGLEYCQRYRGFISKPPTPLHYV